jgi:hypothetical protein
MEIEDYQAAIKGIDTILDSMALLVKNTAKRGYVETMLGQASSVPGLLELKRHYEQKIWDIKLSGYKKIRKGS